MSALATATNPNSGDAYFLLKDASTLTFQSILANNISTGTLGAGNIVAQEISSVSTTTGTAYADFVDATSISTQFINCTSSLSTFELQADTGYISSIYNSGINLDGQELTADANDLLLNGIPIATTANLSSIQDWATFPGISTVTLEWNSLISVNQIRASNIFCANLIASNSIVDQFTSTLNISSQQIITSSLTVLRDANFLTYISGTQALLSSIQTGNISTGIAFASVFNANAVSTNTLSTGTLFAGFAALSSVTANNLSSLALQSGTGVISSLQFGTATGGALSTNLVSTGTASIGNLVVSSINGAGGGGGSGFGSQWSQYPATTNVNMNGFNITSPSSISVTVPNGNLVNNFDVNVAAGDVNITADNGSRLDLSSDITLTAQNGNRGRINLTANAGQQGVFGEVNIVANGGVTPLGVGTGGLVNIVANTPAGYSNLTSAVKINAAGINSYAGLIPAGIGSLAGYNFIYGSAGVNLCAGLPSVIPNIPGTTYIYGTNGVSLDGINTVEVKASLGFESGNNNYFNAIYPFWGGLTNPPDLLIAGRYIIPNFTQIYVTLSNVKWINMDSTAVISNVKNISTNNGVITGCSTIGTNAISANIGYIGNQTNVNLTALGGTSTLISNYSTISAANFTGTNATFTNINGLPVSAYNSNQFSTIFASTAVLSTLNGLPISDYNNSIFSTATISSAVISSLNGYPISEIVNGSTFQNLYVSSAVISSINGSPASALINTNNFSTANISSASISSLQPLQGPVIIQAGTFPAEAYVSVQNQYGISTIGVFGIKGNAVEISATEPGLPSGTGDGNLFLNAAKIGINQEVGNFPGGIYCDISGSTQIEGGYLWVGDRGSTIYTQVFSNAVDTTVFNASTINVSSYTANQNRIFLKGVRQPLIQRGYISSTGGTGSATASWPVPYLDTTYNTCVTMADNSPAQLSVTNDSVNGITIYWANAGGGNHAISWVVMGDIPD